MVDSIGFKAGAASVEPRAMTPVAPAPAPKPVVVEAPEAGAVPEAREIARSMSASAPVDFERVAQIRKAIQDGKFPLVTSTAADRLLALKMQWDGGDDEA